MNEYIKPKRIICEKDIINSIHILKSNLNQAVFNDINCIKIKKGGHILLDFGKELNGGIVLTIQSVSCDNAKIRIVFGESVMESLSDFGKKNAQNNHSIRDMTVDAVYMSTQRFGETGFRFIKLEAINGDISVRSIQAVNDIRNVESLGNFECNDELLNEIWKTGVYTVKLNMHEYLWDGVKRDRLVWIGDMHPETSVIKSVFGNDECVRRSLDLIKNETKGDWMNGIPTYTFWWVIIHYDLYMHWGDIEYLSEQRDYMIDVANKMFHIIDADFKLDNIDGLFVDWSSRGQVCEIEGVKSIACIALKYLKQMLEIMDEIECSAKCKVYYDFLKNKKVDDELELNNRIAALTVLAQRSSQKSLDKTLSTTENEMSCFMGFYILKALSKMGNNSRALHIIRNYWGAMLNLGATTFWEEFNMKWAKNAARIDEIVHDGKDDIHGDFGEYCYKQYRLSLCHGWASGPTSFLSENIAGIEILEPGCKKIKICPDLAGLEWVNIDFPTPYGIVRIEYRCVDDKTNTNVTAPDGVEIVY